MILPRHSSLMVFFCPLQQLQRKQTNLKKETSEEEQLESDELERSEELSEKDDKLLVTELSLLSVDIIIYKKNNNRHWATSSLMIRSSTAHASALACWAPIPQGRAGQAGPVDNLDSEMP
jgi:hypothetical protein